jgi:serine/threonine protein kinase
VADFAKRAFIFDVWSLGSILLEILSGFPLWLSLKSRVLSLDGRSITNFGLFGVSGRDNQKILVKQNQLLGNGVGQCLQTLKKGFDITGTSWLTDRCFVDLL